MEAPIVLTHPPLRLSVSPTGSRPTSQILDEVIFAESENPSMAVASMPTPGRSRISSGSGEGYSHMTIGLFAG